MDVMAGRSTYERVLRLLDDHEVFYRLLEHEPEGRTERASELRGHPLSAAAKCMVLTVERTAGSRRHVLAVVPGDRRVSFKRVSRACGGGRAQLAGQEAAEELGSAVSGSITPFVFHPGLELLADPALFEVPELFFNAARLDRSLAIRAEDYRRLARPRVEPIT